MFLDEILTHKKEDIQARKNLIPLERVKQEAINRPAPRDFFSPLYEKGDNQSRIIAEIKKASPSKGIIQHDFDLEKIGAIYQKAGARAISILTEKKFFQGDIEYLSLVRKSVDLPLLCKDFIIDPYQIYEAAAHGADGFLLIAAILSRQQIEDFLSLGRELGMEALLEVHNEKELKEALLTSAKIIGINNRDLKTFKTDIVTTLSLIKFIPEGKVIVSESGINTREQIELLEKAGVHAFLIGEALMIEKDPGKKLREFKGEVNGQD
ncbi:MAG: indole-3-glycerol phosphate synthase TrpC [Thermodesulfobacteriota bacterium]|nr:MAG: indole-3-glycerol phosphate synthase TrpC [Thermodesulfobacteriota bacterium]